MFCFDTCDENVGAGIVNMFYPVVPGTLVPEVILTASLAIICFINYMNINFKYSLEQNKLYLSIAASNEQGESVRGIAVEA